MPKSSLATDYPLTPSGLVSIGFFTLGILIPDLSFILIGIIGLFIVVAFQSQAAKFRKTRTLALQDLQSLSHRDLELHVAAVVAALPGWQAEATRGSSDQGADVIATSPKGMRVAIQVKHYPTRNVSNGAVQEIVAAKAIYQCKEAVVFTSGPGYTKSAVELARANGVKLWRPADLFRLQAQAVAKQAAPRELLPA